MSSKPSAPPAPHPAQHLFGLITGKWTSRATYVAAKLGVADLLAQGPKPVDDLARATKTHAPSLFRVLRALASVGVFAEVEPKTFALTPAAELLRGHMPGSLRAFAVMMGEPWSMEAWDHVLYSVQTGEPAFDHVNGKDAWAYLKEHPDAGATFNAAMISFSEMEISAMLNAFDFSGVGTLADVGGGLGHLLAAILRANPEMKGILFDSEEVVPGARELLEKQGVAPRCQIVAGSFFESVPSGADAVILKHILHDWDDERSLNILKLCRKALPKHGRVLIADAVIEPGNGPQVGKLLDLEMLVFTGKGRERTESEFAALLKASGFALDRVVPTPSPVCVVEGRCV